MKIFCIGNASYDITMPVSKFPKENNKYRVESRTECGGGGACTASYLLGKWNMDIYFFGSIGNDTYGNIIKKELDEANVDTTYLSIDSDYKTALSLVIPNVTNSSRTIITNRDKNMKLNIELPNDIPDVILMDGEEYETSIVMLEKYKDSISIMDAGKINDNVIELSNRSKYLICSKRFAEKYTNIKFDLNDNENIKTIYKKLKNDFKNEIIITLEENGALYLYNNELRIMPGVKVSAIDTTGAGDVFHAAFAYCMANNFDLEKSIKISNIAGALSTRNIGIRNSIPKLEEVLKIYEEI